MQDTKRIWVWVGVAVVVIGVVLAVYFSFNKPQSQMTSSTSLPAHNAPAPVLPKQLLLDGLATATGTYSSSSNAYNAAFYSPTSMQDFYYSYMQYLVANDWDITKYGSSNKNSRELFAVGTSTDISVSIVASGTGSEVTINYTNK